MSSWQSYFDFLKFIYLVIVVKHKTLFAFSGDFLKACFLFNVLLLDFKIEFVQENLLCVCVCMCECMPHM